MTKRGMTPGVAKHPDPTFEKVVAKFEAEAREAKRKEIEMAAFRVFAMVRSILNLAGYKIVGELAMHDGRGNLFHWRQS